MSTVPTRYLALQAVAAAESVAKADRNAKGCEDDTQKQAIRKSMMQTTEYGQCNNKERQ
jgi:hypothetical protein